MSGTALMGKLLPAQGEVGVCAAFSIGRGTDTNVCSVRGLEADTRSNAFFRRVAFALHVPSLLMLAY